jgi:hypothetical protein
VVHELRERYLKKGEGNINFNEEVAGKPKIQKQIIAQTA